MKRRTIILVILIYTFIAVSLFARGSHEEVRRDLYNSRSTYIFAIPYDGAFGVNLANSDYDNWNDGNVSWVSGSLGPSNGNYTPQAPGVYTNDEMVGLLEIADAKLHGMDKLEPIQITCSCPQGFELVSQSNPSYRRPFEIILVPRSQYRKSETYYNYVPAEYRGNWSDLQPRDDKGAVPYDGEAILLSGDRPETPDPWIISEAGYEDIYNKATKSNENFKDDVYVLYQWYDIVLNLPGEIDPATDVLTVTNSRGTVSYPLIEGDDYSALVTITIQWGDYVDSITIPFSGYYDRDSLIEGRRGGSCSLFVTPYASASHLSIEKDRGNWVSVAMIDFLMSGMGESTERPLIYASSSSDPNAVSPSEFRLVHDSVMYDTPLTNTNSIGFDVQIRSTDTSFPTASFDGTMNMEEAELAFKKVGGTGKETSSEVIIPQTTTQNSSGHVGEAQTFYTYSGEVDVMMDSGVHTMYEGVYRGTVYLHVVTTQ